MKNKIFYIILFAIASLASCIKAKTENATTDVSFNFDYSSYPSDNLNENLKIIFFNRNTKEIFTKNSNDKINLPSGYYDILCFNENEKLNYVFFEDFYKARVEKKDELIKENLLCATIEDVHLPANQSITLTPLIYKYLYKMEVQINILPNASFVKSISGSLSNLSSGIVLKNMKLLQESTTESFSFDVDKNTNTAKVGFYYFGKIEDDYLPNKLILVLTDIDETSKTFSKDITVELKEQESNSKNKADKIICESEMLKTIWGDVSISDWEESEEESGDANI